MDMPRITTGLGVLLILIGVIGYIGTGAASWTALIPALFGLIFALLGYTASRREDLRKHVMHGAILLALLAFFGTVGSVGPFFRMIGGEEMMRPAAVIAQFLTAVLCLSFIVVAVKSFIDARRARQGSVDV